MATNSDVMTPAQRRRCMSQIHSRDTGPELRLRRALWAAGARYRLRYPLPGRPDLVFPGSHVAVFVDGCFWHGCPEHSVQPQTNSEFWRHKIAGNMARDRVVDENLTETGWCVVRAWEHDVERNLDSTAEAILLAVRQGATQASRGA